jgi:hypothetical protein
MREGRRRDEGRDEGGARVGRERDEGQTRVGGSLVLLAFLPPEARTRKIFSALPPASRGVPSGWVHGDRHGRPAPVIFSFSGFHKS